jgi:hypothetical protein
MTRAMHVNLRWFALLLAVFCTVATALAAKPHERREIKTGAYITSISDAVMGRAPGAEAAFELFPLGNSGTSSLDSSCLSF